MQFADDDVVMTSSDTIHMDSRASTPLDARIAILDIFFLHLEYRESATQAIKCRPPLSRHVVPSKPRLLRGPRILVTSSCTSRIVTRRVITALVLTMQPPSTRVYKPHLQPKLHTHVLHSC